VAEFYARIFFRNCVNGGFLIPCECPVRLVGEVSTGDDVEVDSANNLLINHTTGKRYAMNPLGDVKPIVEAGGVFNYAKKAGMI
jgi:3-isopropylmalate/(R)-2-methylmalate dehydratase small subunit